MTKHEMNIAIQAIRQFVYFTYNFCNMKKVCNEIWQKLLAEHLFGKLNGYDFNFNRWYVEMSTGHQDELAEWIVKNYHGVDSRAPKEEDESTDPDTFLEYCQQHIADKIYNFIGQEFYSDDFPYELTQDENVNGTITFSAEASRNLIKKYWNDAGEYWDWEKFTFGEHSNNPFENPEAYFVCMVIEGVHSILSQTDIIQNMDWQFELTEELADKIVEQANEITKIW